MSWDTKLSTELVRQWKNIVIQANCSLLLEIKRFPEKIGDSYNLIAFTDSSSMFFGCVLYFKNLWTNEVNFLLAKNHIFNKSLDSKSIPSLELQTIAFTSEVLIETLHDLSGDYCFFPIAILNILFIVIHL